MLLFGAEPAAATPPQGFVEFVQFCVENASSRTAIHEHASRERWWRFDEGALSDLKTSTRLVADADVAWLATDDQVIVAITTRNPRLAALGDPLESGQRSLPTQACTVLATRVDSDQVGRDLEGASIFGAPLGRPDSELDLETMRARQWVLRSGQGEVAYVYAEFGRQVAIVEVGRVLTVE